MNSFNIFIIKKLSFEFKVMKKLPNNFYFVWKIDLGKYTI